MTPILATKLYIPRPRPNVVSRPRLLERLNEGLHRKLTLISAPAGFGKTTLASSWVEGIERQVAWLSLDAGENEPTRFLTYLVAALQTITPTIGEGVLGVLQSPQPPPPEAILTALLNEITTLPDHFVLVLDDYHLIDAKPVDMALTYLVEHLPPQMHLVIATREDPQLPLARLRARSHLTEVRAADLRFTASEAAAFLSQVMGLDLSAADIAALEDHTEGWIAGLQLAALSMQGHQDVPGFIQAFAGNHRYIVDYLVEEVLQRQPEPVRSFLLQTSILDRLHGPLCDAVTGQEEGNARLEALERGNFFVVTLDDRRHWYRYHHLFAEVLSAHVLAEQPDQVATLHRRASAWYKQHGSVADAIRHALEACDFGRAADLVELAVPDMRRSRQEATVLGWLKALPDELVRARPVLSVHYAGALLLNGELEGVEARLSDAEQWLDTKTDMSELALTSSAGMVVLDTNHGYAKEPVVNSEVVKRRADLEKRVAHLHRLAAESRKRLHQMHASDQLREAQVVIWEHRQQELLAQVTALETLGQSDEPGLLAIKAQQLEAEWEAHHRRVLLAATSVAEKRELNHCERSCRALRHVLRQQEDLRTCEREMRELDNTKDQSMTVLKVGLANLGMWVRDHYFGESYQSCGWERLMPFFQLSGWVTALEAEVRLDFSPFNHQAMRRDLQELCRNVNASEVHLSDGRRLVLTVGQRRSGCLNGPLANTG